MADAREPGPGPGDTLMSLAAERDYYRHVAERLGRKALGDAQDHTRLIDDLRASGAEITARYDELVRRIPNGVYTLRFRPDGGMRFEYLSPQLCTMLGLDREVALADAEAGLSAIHPDDLGDLRRANEAAIRAGDPLRWEGRFVVAGETRWIRLEAEQTVLPGG